MNACASPDSLPSQDIGAGKKTGYVYPCLLLVIVAVAILVRIWGIDFRHGTWDEEQIRDGAYSLINSLYWMFTGHDHPRLGHREIVSIYGIAGKYLAVLPCLIAYPLRDYCSAGLLTRLTVSFVPSVLTLYLVHQICRLISDSKALRIGALCMLALAFKHVETAHFAVADSLSAFFATACLLFLMRWCLQPLKTMVPGLPARGRSFDLMACALLAAAGASTRINVGACLVLTIAFTVITSFGFSARECCWTSKSFGLAMVSGLPGQARSIVPLSIAGTAFVLAFVLINMPYLLHWRMWLQVLTDHLGEMDCNVRWHGLYYLCMSPALGMGGGMALLAILGIFTALEKKWLRIVYPLGFYALFFYIFLSLASCAVHRWIIPMIPVLAIFGGLFIDRLHAALRGRMSSWAANCLVALVIVAAVAPSFYHIALFDLNLTEHETTYAQVARFAENHPPAERWIGDGVVSQGLIKNNRGLNEITDERELDAGFYDYAVLDDFLHPLHHPFPEFLLDYSAKRQHANQLAFYIRENWQLVAVFESRYYTPWADGIARQSVFWIYRRPGGKKTTDRSVLLLPTALASFDSPSKQD